MNEKDKELIKSLASLLSKLKKLFHFGTIFSHPHASVEDDSGRMDTHESYHKNVNLVNTAHTNDTTGDDAMANILKNENLTNHDN
jgi:hypothetical protein